MERGVVLLGLVCAMTMNACDDGEGSYDGFADRAADLQCQRYLHCSGEYTSLSEDECRSRLEDQWQDKRDNFEELGCDFDPEVGRACLRELSAARSECGSQSEAQEACAPVFNCLSTPQ